MSRLVVRVSHEGYTRVSKALRVFVVDWGLLDQGAGGGTTATVELCDRITGMKLIHSTQTIDAPTFTPKLQMTIEADIESIVDALASMATLK